MEIDEIRLASNKVRDLLQMDKYIKETPFLYFPKGFGFKTVYPFHGAQARFFVDYKGQQLSVYLDTHNQLGYMNGPYWEAYSINGDAIRFDIADGKRLVKAIVKELKIRDSFILSYLRRKFSSAF